MCDKLVEVAKETSIDSIAVFLLLLFLKARYSLILNQDADKLGVTGAMIRDVEQSCCYRASQPVRVSRAGLGLWLHCHVQKKWHQTLTLNIFLLNIVPMLELKYLQYNTTKYNVYEVHTDAKYFTYLKHLQIKSRLHV